MIPPGDCGIRIEESLSHWQPGRCLLFDDTYVHEAWNRTKQDRIILLMRILHPDLSREERAAFFRIEQRFEATAIHQTLMQLKKLMPKHAA